MIEKRFISEVMNYERITLGATEDYFLNQIGMSSSESAYSIFISLKKDNNLKPPQWVESRWPIVAPMAYKNVHKRIKKLESLRLIEKVPGEQLLHKAIRYRLTTRGLFQCLQKAMISAAVVVMDKDNRYKKNFLLKTILYQFFEFETIKQFGSEPRLLSLGKYLQSCSQAILSKVEEFRSSRFKDKEKWLADDIDVLIDDEIRKFIFEIVTNIRTKELIISRFDGDNKEYARHRIYLEEKDDRKRKTLFPTLALAKDKKFLKRVNQIKREFDDGYKEFSSFSSSSYV